MLENKAKKEKKHTHYTSETNAKNQHWNVVSFICTACHYAWLLVLLSSLSFFLHLFLTFLTRLCIAFAIYCIHMSVEQAKEWKKSREPFVFLFTKKNLNIWIFMRTCFDSGCRSALAKPSCLSGFVLCIYSLSLPHLLPFPFQLQVLFTFEPFEWPREVEKNDNKSQRKKCAFFWWS